MGVLAGLFRRKDLNTSSKRDPTVYTMLFFDINPIKWRTMAAGLLLSGVITVEVSVFEAIGVIH